MPSSSARVRQLAVDQQVGDLLELGLLGEVEDVVAAVVQVVARRPTVHSAVLPAATPESATDFFGLSERLRIVLVASSFANSSSSFCS